MGQIKNIKLHIVTDIKTVKTTHTMIHHVLLFITSLVFVTEASNVFDRPEPNTSPTLKLKRDVLDHIYDSSCKWTGRASGWSSPCTCKKAFGTVMTKTSEQDWDCRTPEEAGCEYSLGEESKTNIHVITKEIESLEIFSGDDDPFSISKISIWNRARTKKASWDDITDVGDFFFMSDKPTTAPPTTTQQTTINPTTTPKATTTTQPTTTPKAKTTPKVTTPQVTTAKTTTRKATTPKTTTTKATTTKPTTTKAMTTKATTTKATTTKPTTTKPTTTKATTTKPTTTKPTTKKATTKKAPTTKPTTTKATTTKATTTKAPTTKAPTKAKRSKQNGAFNEKKKQFLNLKLLSLDAWTGQVIKIEFSNSKCALAKFKGGIDYPVDLEAFKKKFPKRPTMAPKTTSSKPTVTATKPTKPTKPTDRTTVTPKKDKSHGDRSSMGLAIGLTLLI